LEIIEQCPGARTIVVPVGGGGLAAGIALAVKAADPAIRVIGVQADTYAAYPASFAAGHPVAVTPGSTMADGIAVAQPGELAFGLLAEGAVRVVPGFQGSLSPARPPLLQPPPPAPPP